MDFIWCYMRLFWYIDEASVKASEQGFFFFFFSLFMFTKRKIYSRVICDVRWFTIEYWRQMRLLWLCFSCLLRFLTVKRYLLLEVFIPSVEQMKTAKAFIIHRLVLDLNHLDRAYEDLRSKNSLITFSRWTSVLLWY